jgi:ABC-type Fe3+ transport system permease subunit
VAQTPSEPLGTEQDEDLTAKAMGALDQLVDWVHDKFIRPVLLVGRTIAFSFIIIFAVLVVAVAFGVAVMRFMNVYFFEARPWLSWAVIGIASLVGGLVIWRRRTGVPTKTPNTK